MADLMSGRKNVDWRVTAAPSRMDRERVATVGKTVSKRGNVLIGLLFALLAVGCLIAAVAGAGLRVTIVGFLLFATLAVLFLHNRSGSR